MMLTWAIAKILIAGIKIEEPAVVLFMAMVLDAAILGIAAVTLGGC